MINLLGYGTQKHRRFKVVFCVIIKLLVESFGTLLVKKYLAVMDMRKIVLVYGIMNLKVKF